MIRVFFRCCVVGLLAAPLIASAENDVPTEFTNVDSVLNTRHNMMQSTMLSGGGVVMTNRRNIYSNVCVYCHTPHAANANTAAPLWNRIVGNATYTLYSSSTMTEVVNNPGAASLPCLSCHDGTQAVDAVLNMPGSGQYSASAQPWTWTAAGPLTYKTINGLRLAPFHEGLNAAYDTAGTPRPVNCMTCHNPTMGYGNPGDPTDFTAFLIGTSLNNDHPLGVKYPTVTGSDTGWNTPGGTKVSGGYTNKFFDENSNGRMDKNDVRLYDSGGGARVECGSCHDPHGVPSGAAGSAFLPSFLRKTTTSSAICLTCHAK